MFEATGAFTLLDYFRVPCEQTKTGQPALPSGIASLSVRSEEPFLGWPTRELLGGERALEEFAADATAWKALPRDVSDWWRRRAKPSLQESGGECCIVGPAEGDERIEFMSPQAPAV